MVKRFIMVLAVCFMASVAQAQEVKVGDLASKFPIKEGYFFDLKEGKGYNAFGLELAKKDNLALNLAYFGADGGGVVADYNLSGLPVENVPVLKLVEYLTVGYGVGVRRITLTDIDDNPDSDNQLIHGPVAYVKIKW